MVTRLVMGGVELPLLLPLLLLLPLDLVLVFGRAAGLQFVAAWVERDDDNELIIRRRLGLGLRRRRRERLRCTTCYVT